MAETLKPPAGQCEFATGDSCDSCDTCEAVQTVCYMCSSECGLILHKRAGRICGVFADPAHPMNQGAFCPKSLAIPELVHSRDRIRSPLKRVGKRGTGEFQPISWQQALEEIAAQLVSIKKSEGPQSLLVQFGEKPDHDLMYRFANAYGTPNVLDHDSLCDTNRRQGFMFTYGKSHFRPLPDLNRPLQTVDGIRRKHDSRHLLLLGENPMEATRFLYLRQGIREAIRQGMRLTVVDPFRTATAKLAQSWLAVRPGSDLALVFAILRFLIEHDAPNNKERSYLDHHFIAQWTEGFQELRQYLLSDKERFTLEWAAERTGLDAQTIATTAHEFGITKPAAAMVGMNGVSHHSNGLLTTRLVATLVAITGNLDVPGGLSLAPQPQLATNLVHGNDLLPQHLSEMHKDIFAGHPLAYQGIKAKNPQDILQGIRLSHGAHAGEQYRLRSLFLIHGNPLINAPGTKQWRKALTQRDEHGEYKLRLVVFNDTQLNDTGLYADYVLPMASFVERQGLCKIYGNQPIISLRQALLPPLHASRQPLDWLNALAQACVAAGDPAMNSVLKYSSDDTWCNELLSACPGLQGYPDGLAPNGEPLTIDWLRSHGGTANWPAAFRKYDSLDTPSGKVEIKSSIIQAANQAFGCEYDPLIRYQIDPWTPEHPEYKALQKKYPFQLITGRSFFHTGSLTQNLPKLLKMQERPCIFMNQEDAASLGLAEDDWVVISNPKGASLKAQVKPTDKLLKGVIRAQHGWGQQSTFLSNAANVGYNINLLTDDRHFNPITGNAAFGDMLVAVTRATPQ